MRKLAIALAAVLAAAFVLADAEAARLGGGRSIGAQRSIARTPPASAPAKPAQQQAAPAQVQPQGGFLSKWGPLLGGLAIGGLLGSLFHGSGLGGVLLLALAALAVFMVVRGLMRPAAQGAQYAGLNERTVMPEAPAPGLPARPSPAVPAGFDTASFLRGAKMNFARLQAANDAGNLEELRELTTTEMFDALSREVQSRSGRQQTDIASLDAELLEVASEPGRHWASVRFSGIARESADAGAAAFEEVWNLVKPADGSSGWLLAGIQQLH